jgi:hypothetical protein
VFGSSCRTLNIREVETGRFESTGARLQNVSRYLVKGRKRDQELEAKMRCWRSSGIFFDRLSDRPSEACTSPAFLSRLIAKGKAKEWSSIKRDTKDTSL